MTKLNELLERRAAAIDTMKTNEESGGAAFDTAKSEYDTLTIQIDRARVVENAERQERGKPLNGDGHLETELRQFSIRNAIAGASGIEGVDWGREREMQAELSKRAGRSPKGIFIPTEALETRVIVSSGNGAALTPVDQRPEMYISALAAQSVVRSMGATVLTGLSGDVDIPKEGASPAAGWKGENTDFDSGDATFASVGLSPKHCGTITEWSRNMIMQSSPEIEGLLRNMLARNIALAIDKAAINGAGTDAPLGIIGTAGIQTQAYVTSLLHTAAEMIAKADISNVGAKRSFLTTNGVRKLALQTLDGQQQPLGVEAIFHKEPVQFSNQVPSNLNPSGNKHGLLYGDWSELLIGIWSEIDILVNPYESAAYKRGNISMRAIATVDTACRHPEAFVSATGVAVA
jgi:HK97 family phage major capsid protein